MKDQIYVDKRIAEDFFIHSGTLDPEAPSYVTRQADTDLWQALLVGKYCNVLTARQMGKSSLMVRTRIRLEQHGIRTVIIDLAAVGTEGISSNEWFFGLLSQLKRQLALKLDEVDWWTEREQLGPVQRFTDFLHQVVLEEIAEPLVIFIDEIDSTLSLPFTDDFFAAIRAAFNARPRDPVYEKLTFVLLGVARPADLIKARTRTPYNIGTSIDVRDFTKQEAQPLLAGLHMVYPDQAETILEQVLYWTDGHPYLTQKLCAQLVQGNGQAVFGPEQVDEAVKRLFLTEDARKETNLQFIRDRINKSIEAVGMLRVYRQVLAGERVMDEERVMAKSQLKLTGLVKALPSRQLVVRNRIYREVFDQDWINKTTPSSLRQRVAIAASLVALIVVGLVGYLIYQRLTLPVEIQAETYRQSFENASSAEARLDSLVNLMNLGERFESQVRDAFFTQPPAMRNELLTGLSDPQSVGTDVLQVVQAIYQDPRLENTPQNNQLLRAMAKLLNQVKNNVPGASRTELEIASWVAGREEAIKGNLEVALDNYDQALELNKNNSGVYFDRAEVYIAQQEYGSALTDLAQAVALDETRQEQIVQLINNTPDLFTFLGQNHSSYTIAALFPTLTPTSTPTATPISPPTPTQTFTPIATPTSTDTPTHTPRPTITPTPTSSPTPTDTPTPTAIFTPTPAPIGVFYDFESPKSWTIGDQPYGTFGRSDSQAYQGDYSGELIYDFSPANTDNDFVVFETAEQVLGGRPNQITVQVYGDGSNHYLNIWIKDNVDETWAFTFGQINHSGWQQMTANLDTSLDWPVDQIGGPGNNILDYPLRFKALVLDRTSQSNRNSGTIYIDNLATFFDMTPPTPTAVPPGPIDFKANPTTLNVGECADLSWSVENVREVHLDYAPVTGQETRRVCPRVTTTYTLQIKLINGSSIQRLVTIAVNQ